MIDFRALVGETIRSPATAAQQILRFDPSREAALTGFALVMVLSGMLDVLQRSVLPVPTNVLAFSVSPVATIFLLAGLQLFLLAAVVFVGRWLGGQGQYIPLLALLSWLGIVSLGFQFLTLVLLLIVPLFAALLNVAVALYGFYVFVQFVNQAHGFDNLLKSFGVVFLSGLLVVMSLLLLVGV